jgi:vancomycin aglycone glucosyltransferase
MVANPLQVAGRSIAELLKIPYVYLAYSTNTLPSWNHAPPRIRRQAMPRLVNGLLWMLNDRGWNWLFRAPINEQRAAIGLAPIQSLPHYVFTDRPWLAADPVMAPAEAHKRMMIFQTGTFFLRDATPLPDALLKFLNDGEPPILFGFGSTGVPRLSSETMLQAARKVGRRAIFSHGWSNLEFAGQAPDCMSIGDVDYEKFLPHVAAIVHHGGSGTTAAAARAGRPQVIVPNMYDQFYWAHRVERLGVGTSIMNISTSATDQLAAALRTCFSSQIGSRAQALALRVEQCGVSIAADKLTSILRG